MITEDYVNFSLEKCSGLIRKYQKSKDKYIRDLLLAKFDKYLGYVIYDLRRKYAYLRGEDLQGLYHTAILGFYKAMDMYNCNLPPKMIFFVIRSYVRNELDIFYAYKVKEQPLPDLLVNFEDLDFGYNVKRRDKFYAKCSVTLLLDHPILTKNERDFLDGMYCKGLSRKEMAESSGYSEANIALCLKNALRKLRKVLKKSKEREYVTFF